MKRILSRPPAVRKSNDAKAYSAPALEKGLDVIELLARQSGGLTKSSIARELNRTVSEVFRMLVCLEQRGYISQLEGEAYSLTLKLFKLVQEHPPTERLIANAIPIMHHIAQETLQSCHLGVIEDGRVVILAQVNAPTRAGFYVKLGSTIDALDAATGYVILAHQDKAVRDRTLREWQEKTGKQLPANINGHFARIRRAGCEKRASYQVRGVVNITYPIFGDRGFAVGAITVPFIQHAQATSTPAKVASVLQRYAMEITASIGGKK